MNPRRYLMAGASVLLLTSMLAGPAALASQVMTRATAGFQSDRAENQRRPHETLTDYLPGESLRPSRSYLGERSVQKLDACCEFRIFEARSRLFDDFDRDGYYTYLRLSFDVDTDYAVADVYADVYLVDSVGQFTRIYETDLFTIYGSADNDDYEIEAELVAGFPPDDYDVLIEVYDAYDDSLAVEFGAWESAELSLLPMEDISFDSSIPVVYAEGGGGAMALPMLLALLIALLVQRIGAQHNRSGTGLALLKRSR
jgi:hypothetical protein